MSIIKASSPLISTAKLACAGTATMPVASGFQISNKKMGIPANQIVHFKVWHRFSEPTTTHGFPDKHRKCQWVLLTHWPHRGKMNKAKVVWPPIFSSCLTRKSKWFKVCFIQIWSNKLYLSINYWWKTANMEALVALSSLLTPFCSPKCHIHIYSQRKGWLSRGKNTFLTLLY